MRSACACLDCFDVEFDPISVFKMMNAPIESQQELEGIVGRFRPLSYIHDMLADTFRRLGSGVFRVPTGNGA